MDFPVPFGDFAAAAGSLTLDAFAQKFPHPFIELQSPGAVPSLNEFASMAATSNHPAGFFQTDEVRRHWRTSLIYGLVKSRRNGLQGQITLGRAPSNDLVLPNASVSKVHAFFRKDLGTGLHFIHDANSRFGTLVKGARLSPGDCVSVESGTEIVLAQSVRLFFYLPRMFFDHMRHRLRTETGARPTAPGSPPAAPGRRGV